MYKKSPLGRPRKKMEKDMRLIDGNATLNWTLDR